MRTSIDRYLKRSREPHTAALLVLPLFVIYQVGILATGGIRNGVDFVTSWMLLATGGNLWAYLGINAALLVAFGIGVGLLRRSNKGKFRLRVWPGVIAESTVYAMFLGTAVITLMQNLGIDQLTFAAGAGGQFGVFDAFILSLGAGIYEELVFRVALMGGLFLLFTRTFKWASWVGALVAVLASSAVFSWIHYVGPMGEAFVFQSFMFRFFAGVILAVIFHLRGFAVVVYTHAIYDILVMVVP